MLKNWTFLYSVTKNLQKFKSNHNPSIELLKSVINSFTSQTVLWNFCVLCVCLCVFMSWVHTEGHRWLNLHWAEETICQDPLPWLTSLHIRAEKSGRRERKKKMEVTENEMRKGWKREGYKQERDSGEGRGEGRGRTRCWCPGDSDGSSHTHIYPSEFLIQILSQDTAHSSPPGRSLWARRRPPDYEVPRNSPLYQVKTHSSKPSSSVWTSSYPSVATKDLSLVCLLFFPDRGSSVDLDGPSLAQRAITSNKTSFKMYISQVMGEGRILGCSNSQRLKKGIKHVALAVFGEFNKYLCPSALVFPPPSSQDVHGEWAAWIRVSVH